MDERDDATLDLPLPRLSRVCFSEVAYLTDEEAFTASGVRLAFFERGGGVSEGPFSSLNLGMNTDDDPAHVAANRLRALEAIGAASYANTLLVAHQVHGDRVLIADDAEDLPAGALAEGADALICSVEHVPVLFCYADCVPVVLVAPGGCFAVVHAGWRGALAGISGKALSLLCEHVPCAPASVNAYLGPHIGGCCYEVSADLLARFRARFGDACDAGASHLSLSAAIESDLRSVGAAAERIVDSGLCTYEHDGFFSYRASAGTCGRHGAMVCRV